MTSLPSYHLWEVGHDTFPVRIAYEKAKIWLFCLIGRENYIALGASLRLVTELVKSG